MGGGLQHEVIAAPAGWGERLSAVLLRGFLRLAFRAPMGPPLPPRWQRRIVAALAWTTPGVAGTRRQRLRVDGGAGGGVAVEQIEPGRGGTGPNSNGPDGGDRGLLLYLHGGAYLVGSPATHRSVTTRLARLTGCRVWVPDYRLAPEHPHPAALDDALACWRALLAAGQSPRHIVVAGDSAGGGLALALCLRLKQLGLAQPAGLLLASPFVDPTLSGASLRERAACDPMLREGWLRQAVAACATPAGETAFRPLAQSLAGLPPMLVQVGSDEILYDDAQRLAERAAADGVEVRLEVWQQRWHVFQLLGWQLGSARRALARQAACAAAWLAGG